MVEGRATDVKNPVRTVDKFIEKKHSSNTDCQDPGGTKEDKLR